MGAFVEGELYPSWMQFFPSPFLPLFFLYFSFSSYSRSNHSVLYINNSGSLQVTDLWYDWPNGRNFNIIQKQLGSKLYDLEWNNGASFYYYLDKNECKRLHFELGILKPNWLEGAKYLGMEYVDGFLCNVWEKMDLIWYYEDSLTNRPVHWRFFTGWYIHCYIHLLLLIIERVMKAQIYNSVLC